MKRVALVVGMGLVLAVSVAAVAQDPVGSCPRGDAWFRVPTSFVIPDFDQGAVANLDHNEDGWVCVKLPPGFCEHANQTDPGKGAECEPFFSVVVKDNTGKL